MECLIGKFDNKEYDSRRTAEEMDEMRHKTLAYEYLCHLEEAKVWLESCLKEKLPATTELEENLRNGVYLAKLGNFISPEGLPANKIYDTEQRRYKIAGLQFRHTDNINQWLKVLKTTELPITFHPETTDIYDKKNMPRVIYCIHALSTHLFKLGKAPLIQDLYGKAAFTDEEINAMSKELKRYGIVMPAFQKIGGLLSSNLEGDTAILHAAVININNALDLNCGFEESLLNPSGKLNHVLEILSSDYYNTLKEAKKIKVRNCANRSLDDSYVADVYDELLTQVEIQGHITGVNFSHSWGCALDAVANNDSKLLGQILLAPWLQLSSVNRENSALYLGLMKNLDENCNNVRVDDIFNWHHVLQTIVNEGNSISQDQRHVEIVIRRLNHAIDQNLPAEVYKEIVDLKNYAAIDIDEYSLPLVFEEMKLDKIESGKELSYDDVLNSTRILSLIGRVSKAVDRGSWQGVWNMLNQKDLPLEGLRFEEARNYTSALVAARRVKQHADLTCSLLTLIDIQECIDEVNLQDDNTHDLISDLQSVNEAVENDDHYQLMAALKNGKFHSSEKLVDDDSYLYLRLMKMVRKKKCNEELWLEDINNVIEEVALETRHVQSISNHLAQINLALLRIDANAFISALRNIDLEIIKNSSLNIDIFEKFLSHFEEINLKNTCPWIVHHTTSGKTVYINIETYSHSWDTPKDFKPHSRFLSMKDVNVLMLKDDNERRKKRELQLITKLQAHIRGYLVRLHLFNRFDYFKSKLKEIILIQAWWKSILVQKKFSNILKDRNSKRLLLKKMPRDPHTYYKLQENNIIKIQALWRGKRARQAFLSLFQKKDPPFKVVKHFVPLLDFSTDDYEKEILLQSLRAEAVQSIRKNQELSKQLDNMDIKIGLLVQNRITLEDVIVHRTKMNEVIKRSNSALRVDSTKTLDCKQKNILSNSVRGLKSLTKGSRKLLDGYQYLFYALQTNPSYLSKLLFCLPQSRTNQFLQNVILTLYNFGSNTRDEYLLLKLFRSSLEEEIICKFSKPLDVITGNPIVLKMAVNHARQMTGLTSLRNIVGPLIEKMLNDKNLSIETSPIDIYKTWRNQLESKTGQISALPHTVTQEQALSYEEVKSRLNKGLQTLVSMVTLFLDRITTSHEMLPFSILYMARVLHHTLLKKFPFAPEKDILKVVGHLIYYQFINAAIVAPDAFDIVTLPHDKALSNDQRRNLASVAKILHFSASKKGFGEESSHLQCLNTFIIDCHEKMKNFFRQCCQGPSLEEYFCIDEYSEATLLYKPHIYINIQEICDTHSLLVEYEDIIAPDSSDRLHELLDALGPADSSDLIPLAAMAPLTNTEVCLTLVDKYQLPADDMTDVNKLFIKTKELCVSVLPFLNGDHLLEALCIGTTKEQQEQYRCSVQQKLYSGVIKPNANMTLREHISQLRMYLNKLEEKGYVTREDGYQSIVTAIALDLCNKGKYRRGQLKALQMMKKTKQTLDQKTRFYEEQCHFYNQYINKCLENLNAGKRTVHSMDRKGNKAPEKVKSKKSLKYSANKLHEKGILIEIDGLTVSQFKNVQFEIAPTNHNGLFTIKGKFMGVKVEEIELDLQNLLQLQYDGCSIMDLFGKAKINVNLLLFLLNTKFYGKK